MNTVVVDTNVILVANGQHDAVRDTCIASCAQQLAHIAKRGRIAIDSGFRILSEYQNKASPHSGKRPGDVFLKWVLRNNANAARCDQVALVEHGERAFESFPAHEQLADFDRDDRKFVAVANAHPKKPPILQATDSKWLRWKPALEECGLSVQFLCPSDIESFDASKRKRRHADP